MRLEVDSADIHREELKRVLTSILFSEAPVRRKLLSFLAEKYFSGSAGELKEYAIGVELFSKRQSYSPQEDPSVRVQTSRLRTRLEEYYRTEGAASHTVIRLPKGSFTLTFEDRRSEPVIAGVPVSMPASYGVRIPWRRIAILAIFSILAGALAYEVVTVQRLKEEVAQIRLDPNVARL